MNDVLRVFETLVFVKDRENLIDDIEIVKREIFSAHSSGELEVSLRKSLSESRAKEFFVYLNRNIKKAYDTHTIEEILDTLRNVVSTIETVTVYLPVELTRQELVEMQGKLVKLLDKQILLDIRTEPTLLGGLKLEYEGFYLDLSLSTKLKKITLETLHT